MTARGGSRMFEPRRAYGSRRAENEVQGQQGSEETLSNQAAGLQKTHVKPAAGGLPVSKKAKKTPVQLQGWKGLAKLPANAMIQAQAKQLMPPNSSI